MNVEAAFHVVYLTGPPATGKSTVAALLKRSVQPIQIISYSAMLEGYINAQSTEAVTVTELRRHSATRVPPEVVAAVDQSLIELVSKQRHSTHIIIDSHPVTKEEFGFRVTAFSIPILQALAPTMICMLYADSYTIQDRLEVSSEGRKPESAFEIEMHRSLQASLATVYGIAAGVPIYFLDSSKPPRDVAHEIAKRLQAKNPETSYEPTSAEGDSA